MSTGFTPAQRAGIMSREGSLCAMCGQQADEVNHRLNRGQGGSKLRNTTDNGCALCRAHNRDIEAVPDLAREARRRGVKLRDGDDPAATPIWLPFYGQWCQPSGDVLYLLGLTDPTLDAVELGLELAGQIPF